MTEEQKEILIAKMLDAPSSLSDEEVDMILHDDELRDIYDVSATLGNACGRQPEFDMEAEWNRFRPRIRRKPSSMRWVMRVAAIFLGVMVSSGITVRIIDSVFSYNQPSAIAKAEQSQEQVQAADNSPAMQKEPHAAGANEDARQIPAIAANHSVAPARHSAKSETTVTGNTNRSAPMETDIDVDEYLRIQQARIDNDLAVQVAESYIEEYDDYVLILDAAGAYDPELDNMIRKVAME